MPIDDTIEQSNPVASGALGAAGAANLAAYLHKVKNIPKNVLVSYGAADPLGGGHRAPAQTMINLMKDDPRFDKYKFHEAPMGQSGTLIEDPSLLNKKYLASLDTHWGVTDAGYRNSFIDFLTSRLPAGKFKFSDKTNIDEFGNVTGSRSLNKNIGRRVIFQPDPPDTNIKSKLTGMIQSTDPLKNVTHATYGSKKTTDGKMALFGERHPGVDYDSIGHPIDRTTYLNELDAYLKRTVSPNTDWKSAIGNKKIITVSGATRGDSVGIRVRRLHDALQDAGKLDNYFIVGLGAKGQAEESAIAHYGRPIRNAAIGGFAPSSQAFVNLANNSDLHYMGMGGATPIEMLAHGGAPIIFDKNEQMYIPNKKQEWTYGGGLLKGQGLFGEERRIIRKLVKDPTVPDNVRQTFTSMLGSEQVNKAELQAALKEAVKRHLPKDTIEALKHRVANALPDNARPWMNPEYYKEAPGVYHQASGGLDFNRNLMRDRYGIKEVETPVRKLTEKSQFGTAHDPILPVIEQHVHNHDPKKWQQIAHDVRTSGKESQEAFKLEFLNILKGEEKAQKLKALLMHGAPGVALGALSIPQVRGALGRVEQATADKLKEKLSGDDFTLQNPHTLLAGMGAAGLGTSAAVSGALANSYGNRLQALTEALRKNPSHLSDPKKVAKYFQEYADIMKRAQNLPLGGVLPARVVTSALSPSQLSKDPLKELQYRLSKMVPGVKLPAKEHAAHLDMEKHYKGFQTNPEQTLASEIANKNLSTVETRDISQVLSPRTVKDILVRKGVSIPANLKDNQLYELARTHNIRTLSDVIPQDSLRKFLTGDARNMTQRLESLKGVHKGVLSDILRHRAKIMLGPTEQAAATQYGKFMNNAGKLHMYGGGALAGVGGLMSLLSFMRNKKKNEGVQNA